MRCCKRLERGQRLTELLAVAQVFGGLFHDGFHRAERVGYLRHA